MFEWLKKLLRTPKALEECEAAKQAYWNTIDSMNNTLNLNKKELETKSNELKILSEQVIVLQAQIPKPEPMESHYNNKYPKQEITYEIQETDGEYEIDVRNFFQYHDHNLPSLGGTSNDDKALRCLLWVMGQITYTPDKETYGFSEYWAFPWQTLKRKKGDCEDGAILLANLLMKAGIPYWRIRLNAGDVNGGGHCYVTYCRESDNQFVVLDWCYWPSKKPIAERPTHEQERNYNDKARNFYIWFSWNELYSFGKMQTMKTMPGVFKHGEKWK